MSTQHTPGPWEVGPTFSGDEGMPEVLIGHRIPPSGRILTVAVAFGGLSAQGANSRLIAAAPELLLTWIRRADHPRWKPPMFPEGANVVKFQEGSAA